MKKGFLLFLALATLSSAVFARKKSKKTDKAKSCVSLVTSLDSVSYAIGASIGLDVKRQLVHFLNDKQNNDILVTAFRTAVMGDSTFFNKREADSISNTYIAAELKKRDEARKTENNNFLATNSKKEGVMTTESGLQYKMIKTGNGKKPSKTDTVKVNYEGTLIDGTVFDSSFKRNQPIEFPLDQVIKGWTEGLQLMDEGSEYMLYIPAELGYGARPTGNIPPYSTLIFKVELLEIK